jgi:hypothetical protein
VPYFPDVTENFTKHPKNRSPYVLIPLKVQLIPFKVVRKANLTCERTGGQVFKKVIILYENLRNENRNENLKGSQ